MDGTVLLLEPPPNVLGAFVYLPLDLVAGITYLTHGTTEGTGDIRYALGAEEHQHEQEHDDEFTAADIEQQG